MFVQAKAVPKLALGAYLHVPFCAHTCDFCGFYQEAPKRGGIDAWLATMEREIAANPPPRPFQTVFFGGGTPGLLMARDLRRLGTALAPHLDPQGVEWTVEMAPSTVKPDKVDALLEMGVTRISMGVQSFSPALLEKLGRQHSAEQVYRAIETFRERGLSNLNLDLIFAIPGQSLEDWERDLREAISIGPEHLSTYCLTFEEDTALWVRLQRGAVVKHSEADEVAFYEIAWREMAAAGFEQYEVSNYARPGYACQHNCDTWRMQEWIGYGPSASSQFEGLRYTNSPDLKKWGEGVAQGLPARVDQIPIDDAILATDALIFGLRMNVGIDREQLEARFPEAPWTIFDVLARDLEEEGLLEKDSNRWRLTPAGRLIADGIGGQFLEASS
jgi:oxygen-independent coproporphyrinogen-3 oxidase